MILKQYLLFYRSKGQNRSRVRKQKQHKIEEIVTYVDVDSNKTAADAEAFDGNYSTKEFTSITMSLNIEEAPRFHYPSFDELDYKVRHPEPVSRPVTKTSLVDDFSRKNR